MRGLRKADALDASLKPRRSKILAAAGGMLNSRASASDELVSAGKIQRLVIGIETAKPLIAGTLTVVSEGNHGTNLLAGIEEIFVPIGTGLVDKEVRVVTECEFEGAG
jgi:hypothetical protein